ncbi:RHS repeat-associated core domain-containing protein [Streptomyces sp. 8N706]|uniref:RHS repeat-associated core domain-containing protein n=1 Tax=Streptomyces sp. 8N706 TaxID=3457416 RepID=UPI003FD2A919
MVNADGEKVNTYTYSPRGVTNANETVSQPYRFASGYQDPTGLYHYQARFYDPNLGRFTQPDPSGLEANPYLYASGDPTNIIDPSGLWGWSDIGEGIGGIVGTAVGVAAVATVCATGVGCLVAGAVMGGVAGGSGAAIGSAIAGGDAEDRSDAFVNGALWGTAGSLAVGPLARFLRR